MPNPSADENRFTLPKPRVGGRIALMSAVAGLALAAAAGAVALATQTAQAQTAQAQTAQTIQAPAPQAHTALNHQIAPAGAPSFADLVERVKGAVVSVKVKQATTVAMGEDDALGGPGFGPGAGPGFGLDDNMERFFRRFGGGKGPEKPRGGMSMGSGFIVSADGYVVTNNHVVAKASDVEIGLDGGRSVKAKVVGVDEKTDLALLKIDEPGAYPYVQFGEKAPRVGDWVIAVGNPFGLGGTVTAGIVSARGRDIGSGPYDDYLQIDAPVNRGNSGGPTFDAEGQVVGVNTAIYSPSGGSVGIGFAIPSEVAKDVIVALKEKGAVSRGYIGVQIQPVTQEIADSLALKQPKGALVAEAKSGPAAEAGIQAGDVIVAVNGEKIDSPRDLARKIAALGPEKAAKLTYMRAGSERTAEVKLSKLPVEKHARAETSGHTESRPLAGLGVELAAASALRGAGKTGAVVADIDPSGVAAAKGLRVGDVILEVGGKPVAAPNDVVEALKTARKDGVKAVLMRIKSADGMRFVAIAPAAAG